MAGEEKDTELTDIVLCYQAMGVPLDSSPAAIERAFRMLTDASKEKYASTDPAIREDGRQSLELLEQMYSKIQNSVTYKAMEREQLRRQENSQKVETQVKRPVHRAVLEQKQMVLCPRCNGSIAKGEKTCPICKSAQATSLEKLLAALFSRAALIAYGMVLVLAVAGFFFYQQNVSKAKDSAMDLESLEKITK
jgi:hypothetical protein